MRLSIAIAIPILTTVIAVPQLRTSCLPHVSSLLDSGQSPLSVPTLRHPAPEREQPELEREEDYLHGSNVSVQTYEELGLYTKYSSAVYQFLCPRPLGNSLVRSVSLPRSGVHCSVVLVVDDVLIVF
jgi:hypothetical protein